MMSHNSLTMSKLGVLLDKMDKKIVCLVIFVVVRAAVTTCTVCSEWKDFDGSRYCFINKMTWNDTLNSCRKMGAGLAVPNSQSEQEFIWGMFKDSEVVHDGIWIDCFYADNSVDTSSMVDSNGKWVHSDGTECVYMKWSWEEPEGVAARCGFMSRFNEGLWDNRPCEYMNFAFCELHKSGDGVSARTPLTRVDGPWSASMSIFCLQAGSDGRFASPYPAGQVYRGID